MMTVGDVQELVSWWSGRWVGAGISLLLQHTRI